MGNMQNALYQLQHIDEWNIDQILERCIEIFAQMHMQCRNNCRNKARPIYPDPYYQIHAHELKGRQIMWHSGQNSNLFDDGTELHIACYEGNWNKFINLLNTTFKSVDFNKLFVGVSEWSILNYILDGRRFFVVNKVTSARFKNKYFEHIKIAQYMIDNGLDVNIQNKYGYTVLNEAVINVPDIELARFLLENDANPNIYNIFCSTVLHECCLKTNVECTKLLCEFKANPLLYNFQGYQILNISSAKNHIEISTIINNRIRKMKENVNTLEYEDANYCFVCNQSNKNKQIKLYRCSKCISSERYCSKHCQELDWKRHKDICDVNRNKINHIARLTQSQLVFTVKYCEFDLTPTWQAETGIPEYISKHIYGAKEAYENKSVVIEAHHEEYREKRQKQFMKHYDMAKRNDSNYRKVTLYPLCGIRIRFVIKIQAFPNRKWMLCYDKSRQYKVLLLKKKQTKRYNTLYTVIWKNGIDTNNAKKGYFYAFVDKQKKLHVFDGNMVAAQPW